MTTRYFSHLAISGDQVRLDGPEAHHLLHVMRAEIGAKVVLFDGEGSEFLAEVVGVGRGEVELAVLTQEKVDRELSTELTIGVALPKGDRQKWLVEKLVELGVTRLVPLVTERSVAKPLPAALERLQRTVIEASKQCGRNRLMEIAGPQLWPELVDVSSGIEHRWLAHPARGNAAGDSTVAGTLPVPSAQSGGGSGRHTECACYFTGPTTPAPVLLAIGPEGGFTDAEVGLATIAGWQCVDLGPRILRVETAALLLVSWTLLGLGA
jgi:16S rRNA (uracil1498-N3)-methyltransferase